MIMPAGRPDTEIIGTASALIRNIYCDIRVDPVDSALWRRLLSSSAYAGAALPGARQRIPPVTAFLVTVKSTVRSPLRMENTLIRHGATEAGAITAEEMKARFSSASYSRLRFDNMSAFRRILNENDPPDTLDYDRDTISLRLDFIPPNDSVLKIIVFERIPAEVRKFKLRFIINAMGINKTIDFDFIRREYRTTDREYIRIKEKTGENYLYGE